jgi:uncharacterized protein (DUF169 family)
MDVNIRDGFVTLWRKYMGSTELPLVFSYTNQDDIGEAATLPAGHHCLIAALAQVRRGKTLRFDVESVGCAGGRRYLGFSEEIRPEFEYFLSTGIPGKLEGERYKKSPELVREVVERLPPFKAPARFIVFKRWDALEETDEPEVAIFFARPDVLSGLFTLANFDEVDPNGVFAPFAAGCGSIVQYPYLERISHRPRAVVGMFDVSARPHVPADTLSFAVPMIKFRRMIANMEESFLITASWAKVQQRIA